MKKLAVMWPNKRPEAIGSCAEGFHIRTGYCRLIPKCEYFCDILEPFVKNINEWNRNKDYDKLEEDDSE